MCFFPNWKTQSVCGQNGSSEHNAASTAAAKEVLLALFGKYTHLLQILETALERMEMSLFFRCTSFRKYGERNPAIFRLEKEFNLAFTPPHTIDFL